MIAKFFILFIAFDSILSDPRTGTLIEHQASPAPSNQPCLHKECIRDECINPRHSLQKVIEIDENNWRNLLTGEWLVVICSSLRPDCMKLEKILYKLASTSLKCHDVSLAFGDIYKHILLRRQLAVMEQPTVYHVHHGEFRRLDWEQDANSLKSVILFRDWACIPPLPFWMHPTSMWISFYVFAYQAATEITKLGIVGTDYRLATWFMSFLFSVVITMVLWLSYEMGRVIIRFGIVFKRSLLEVWSEQLIQK